MGPEDLLWWQVLRCCCHEWWSGAHAFEKHRLSVYQPVRLPQASTRAKDPYKSQSASAVSFSATCIMLYGRSGIWRNGCQRELTRTVFMLWFTQLIRIWTAASKPPSRVEMSGVNRGLNKGSQHWTSAASHILILPSFASTVFDNMPATKVGWTVMCEVIKETKDIHSPTPFVKIN